MKILKIFFIISLINFTIFTFTGLFFRPAKVTFSSAVISPTPANSCVITINGLKFDVTVFKKIHSGGDVFACGKDMSSIFYRHHSSRYLDLMQSYRL